MNLIQLDESVETYYVVKEQLKANSAFKLTSKFRVLDLSGIEPLTPCLQSRCSPS